MQGSVWRPHEVARSQLGGIAGLRLHGILNRHPVATETPATKRKTVNASTRSEKVRPSARPANLLDVWRLAQVDALSLAAQGTTARLEVRLRGSAQKAG